MDYAVNGGAQSPKMLLKKLSTTLRNGAIAAGQEAVKSGFASIKKQRSY
ncbi:hypothetical protein [Gracilibacillus boraciitolerans]|nr:hypothetical protein [Gracilibacillus boraciitolerans]